MVGTQVASRMFSAVTLRRLRSKGIEVVGTQAIPGADSWADYDVAFLLNDGTIKRHAEVLAIAAA